MGGGGAPAEILSPLHDKSRPREDGRHCLTTTEAQKGRTESALRPSGSHAAYRSMQGPQNPSANPDHRGRSWAGRSGYT